MELQGRKVVVLAEHNYQVLELFYPVIRMKEAGAEVIIAGTGSSDTYRGATRWAGDASGHGYPVTVDTVVGQIHAADIDAVIVPGGFAPDRLRRYPSVLKLVKDAYQQGKVVAAICHAPWVLISAGILKGKTATCVSAIKDDLVNAGANYVDQEVVRDGNLITSRNSGDLHAFCRTIIEALTEK